MELQEILSQVDGFTPPSVTVKIEKVFPRKAGDGDNGPWSFQSVKVNGGELKLKNLDPFPEDRIGETVTLRAFPSKQHGLTGMKVAHEAYQGKTYDKLVITPTCIWEWQGGNGNGSQPQSTAPKAAYVPQQSSPRIFGQEQFEKHLLECADLAAALAEQLHLTDDSARQACFATVCIDAQRHNVILGAETTSEGPASDGRRDALLKGVKSVCGLLNSEGYEPEFTGRRLDKFVNEEFSVSGGLANLTTDNVEDLIKRLSDLLGNFRLAKAEAANLEPDDDDDIPF